ncbi:hypothetical protein ACJJTC_004509 [Scirpophaga incertulas]
MKEVINLEHFKMASAGHASYSRQDHLSGQNFKFRMNNRRAIIDSILNNCINQHNIVLTGDINLDTLTDNPNSMTTTYLNLMASHGLRQGVYHATRIKTCLDHFMVKTHSYCESFVFDNLTDHSPILLGIQLAGLETKNNNHNKTKVDYEGIHRMLCNEKWTDLYATKDPNMAAQILTSKLEDIIKYNTQIILLPKRKMPLKPWITVGVVKSIRRRDKLHKQNKTHQGNEDLKQKFINYRNTLNKLIKSLKRNYYRQLLHKNRGNIKETWNTIKQICNMKKQNQPSSELLKLSNNNSADSLNTANKFFTNIGSDLAKITLNKLNTTESSLSILTSK